MVCWCDSWPLANDSFKVLAKFLCKVWENGGSGWGCQAPVVKRIWLFRIRWTWFNFSFAHLKALDFEEVVLTSLNFSFFIHRLEIILTSRSGSCVALQPYLLPSLYVLLLFQCMVLQLSTDFHCITECQFYF